MVPNCDLLSLVLTAMYLVQILLPLRDNAGRPLGQRPFEDIKHELTKRFKGLTAYSRAPAEGLWKPRRGTKRDDIIVYEVMTAAFDSPWWRRYKKRLEKLFRQESIVIRVQEALVL